MKNKERFTGEVVGGRMAKCIRGIKEDTCWDEHWVLYIGDQSLESAPKIVVVLYAN